MTAQVMNQKRSGIIKYKSVIALAILPVAVALYATGMDIASVPTVLTSGVFPIGFTLLSWGIAAKLVHNLRK